MGCACAIAALSYTHTQTHSSISVSRLVFKPSWKCVNAADSCQWASGDLVGGKKKSSHRIYVLYLVTTRRRSRPIPLDYSWEHITRFLNAKRARCTPITRSEPERQQGTWTKHSSFYLNVPPTLKNCITFSLFFFLFTQKFSPWTKRQEPGTRIADAPRGER